MAEKRYAIVRVDNRCPVEEEEDISEIDRIKMFDCIGKRQCGDCPYGDTKKQLEKKIITAIERAGIDYVQLSKEEIAKEIVEFLGVE